MKKGFLSAISAVVIGASALTVPMSSFAAAENETQILTADSSTSLPKKIVVLSDSISGYTEALNDKDDLVYPAILSNYYDIESVNYFKIGATSDELLDILTNYGENEKNNFKEADAVVISAGANDYLRAVKALAAKLYPDKYNENDPYGSILNIVNDVTNSKNAALEFATLITQLNAAVSTVAEPALDNVAKICEEIRKINPDCKILVQSIYNPALFTQEGLNGLLKSKPALFSTGYNMIRNVFRNNLVSFNEGLQEIDGITIADVNKIFTVTDSDNNYGYADVYSNMLNDDARDFHPNSLGHIAIAAEIIKILGYTDKSDAADYISKYFADLPDECKKDLLTELSITIGDGDKDGNIDASDASIALSLYAAAQTGSDITQLSTGNERIALDVDKNHTIDASDASTILAHYADVQSGGKGSLAV